MQSTDSKPAASNFRLPATLLLLCAPIVAAYGVMLRFAINVPYIDDYPNFLGFLLELRRLPSFSTKLYYFVTVQHDEYKFLFMHMVALAELALTHHVDMGVLSFIGNMFLLALLPLLWTMYIPRGWDLQLRLLLFAPMVYLVFGLNYAEGLMWPSSTLFYVPGIVFSFLALYFLVRMADGRSAKRLGLACAATILGGFAGPNAVVLLPLALALLLWRRAFAAAALWSVAFLCGIAPYLYHYHVLTDQDHAPGHPGVKLFTLFLVSFLGDALPSLGGTLVAGGIILTAVALAVRTGFHRSHTAAAITTLWLLGCAVLVTYGRSHEGLGFARTSRYRIFSDLLLVFCYGFAMDWVARCSLTAARKRVLFQTALAASMVLCGVFDLHAPKVLKTQQQLLLAGLAQYRAQPAANSPMYFPDAKTEQFFAPQEGEARSLMEDAIREGLYVPPALP